MRRKGDKCGRAEEGVAYIKGAQICYHKSTALRAEIVAGLSNDPRKNTSKARQEVRPAKLDKDKMMTCSNRELLINREMLCAAHFRDRDPARTTLLIQIHHETITESTASENGFVNREIMINQRIF
jgi:hypothetical protein